MEAVLGGYLSARPIITPPKTTYLEVPVLWYYRHAQDEQLTVTIEGKESPVRVEEALPAVASGGWLSVHLET